MAVLLTRRQLLPLVAATLITTALQVLATARSYASSTYITTAHDYLNVLWAPTRGLLHGLNPYDPQSSEYLTLVGVKTGSAALHTPSILIAALPSTLLPERAGYLLFVAACCLMLWAALAIVVLPHPMARTKRGVWITVLIGVVLTMGGPAEELLQLGQVSSFVVLGFALVVRYPSAWPGVVGVLLVSTTPQFAIPFTILLFALGCRRVVVLGWVASLLLSIPAVAIAMSAAGGIAPFAQGLILSLEGVNSPGNASNRVDIPGRYGEGSLVLTLIALALTLSLAWWLARNRSSLSLIDLKISNVIYLGMVTFCLIGFYSMSYNLTVAIVAGAPLLVANRNWRPLEWLVVAVVAGSIPIALPILLPAADLLGTSAGNIWQGLLALEGCLLFAIFLVVARRCVHATHATRSRPDAAIRH